MDSSTIVQRFISQPAEDLDSGFRRVLEMLALGESQTHVLTELVIMVEPKVADMICSVVLLDESGSQIDSTIGIHLPQEYSQMLVGLKIGPEAGSCGTAAYRREPVIVEDIDTDPLWRDYRKIAGAFGLKACWSLPIISSQGTVLGTFAVYCKNVRRPTEAEFQLVKDSTHIAAVAIEHSKTREKLQKTISLLNATVESTADGILVVDLDGKITSFNKKFAEMWHLPEDTLASGDDSRALTYVIGQFDHPEAFLSKVLELYNQPEVESFDVLEFKDGRIFERYSKPQTLEGRIVGRVWSFRDVTIQRRAAIEAEAAGRAKAQFLANISHEIRTPVGAMLGYSELLLEPHVADEDRIRWATKLISNGTYLLDVVNDILSLSKAEFGKMHVERVEVNFLNFLSDIADIFQAKAREKGIRLDFIFDGPIPKSISIDSTKLRQILSNIIGNAVKFTNKGNVKVTVKHDENTSLLKFFIDDEGVGIRPDLTAKLFRPFSQADASIERSFGGTGLGLALAQKLARLLGGDVELLHSAPGIGSCFRVTVNIDSPPAKAPRPNQLTAFGASPSLAGMKILVVDDSADNRFLASKFLSMAGAHLQSAENGLEATNMALDPIGNFDLIFMDLKMPEMDGYTATKKLRENGVKIPIIAFTAFAMPTECDQVLQAGFNDYIAKPVRRTQLVECAYRHWKKMN